MNTVKESQSIKELLDRFPKNICPNCGNLGNRDAGYELNHSSPQIEEKTRWSETMGCNPKQIKAMEKQYPGSRYDSKGRLEVSSRQDKLIKMKQRNMIEFE